METDDKSDYRTGCIWTHQEEWKLWEMVENNQDTKIISETLNRSIGSVLSRKKKLAQILIKSGDSIEEIKKITNLELNDLIKVKNKKKSKKQRREEKKIEIDLTDYIENIKF
jgi:hypothetical protein